MTKEETFAKEVAETVKLYESFIPRTASKTRKMLEKYSAKNTAERLVPISEIQQEFKTLCKNGFKEKTFETLVLKYSDLFSNAIINAAKFRLDNCDKKI